MMHTTKWSFEVPIPHLRDFHEDQDFVFALQHLCKDGEYRRYLQTCDKFIILDNSSNEKVQPCSVQELVTTAIDMQAGLIIAPDCDEWSVDATVEKWLETQRLASAVQVNVFGVFRTREEKKALERAGCHFFTIPYEYRFTQPLSVPYSRVHFLGLNNPLEVRVMKPASVDTGMPIKLALRGMTVAQWMLQACPHFHTLQEEEYLHKEMSDEEIRLSKENIKEIKRVCSLP